MINRAAILLGLSLIASTCLGAGNPSIGRMQVALWPEYDDPGILVIYDGRFENVSQFPIKTSFLVPKGAIINDACSLSHEGQHFCQLYTVKKTEEFDQVEVYLPYPNFYLSFHFTAFDIADENRAFSYRIRSNHAIERLEVDIQQPLRSSEFHLSPTGGELKISNNENHYYYAYDDLEPGDETAFNIDYVKRDNKPSVDIKYSRMTGPKVFSSPYETQRKVRTFVYLLFASGLGGVLLLLLWMFRARLFHRGAPNEGDNV
ncbi:MAG: hypothetical protein HOC23_22615 [Halieaceae bacterium]|jgi:hypothetical protein|nr:hypothetical protein [Halieaceae bacterium]